MEEKQEKCFTCSRPILEKLYEYERYREVYGLSRTDAVDKLGLTNICCRVTAYSQSGVEKRIKAAGVVETVDNEIRVTNIGTYPTQKVTRTYKEGPFLYDQVQEAKKVREKIEFDVFETLQPGVKSIPVRAVASSQPEEAPRMSNRDVLGDLKTYPNGIWTLADRATFPKPKEMEEVFNRKDAFINITFSLISEQVLASLRIDKESTVAEALTILEVAMIEPRESLSESLGKTLITKAPLRLDKLLELRRQGKEICIADLAKTTLVVHNFYRDRKAKAWVIDLKHVETLVAARRTLQERNLNSITGTKLKSVVDNTLLLGETKVTFTAFEVRTANNVYSTQDRIPVGGVLQACRHINEGLYISFLLEDKPVILYLNGDFGVTSPSKNILSSDEKELSYLKSLSNL